MLRLSLITLALVAPSGASSPLTPADYAADAASVEAIIRDNYAYPERLPAGRFAISPALKAEAKSVFDGRTLVRFSERAIALLADHHAITGASRKDSWAVFPSFGDLWIEPQGTGFVITSVREGSPAAAAGIRAADQLVAVDGIPTATAVASFWHDLGTVGGGERDGYAARVLAAGQRDRLRRLAVQSPGKPVQSLELPNLYSVNRPHRPPLTVSLSGGAYRIRFNDSLGDDKSIAAFDAAMRAAPGSGRLVIDLTDTPSGGNTVIARAILGWFVDRPTSYQIHRLPVEERRTGIARQWVEQVLPRPGKYHTARPIVLVGRWTGSMGEGLAIGFDHVGARVEGTPMAGLLGAVYDHRLERSGQILKIPTERLLAVDGTPRERFRPKRPASPR